MNTCLHCTYNSCKDENSVLAIIPKGNIQKLRQRQKKPEPLLLVCTKCNRHVSITEKLEDAFSFGSEKYKTQKFPRTSKEKSEFLWNGIDLQMTKNKKNI